MRPQYIDGDEADERRRSDRPLANMRRRIRPGFPRRGPDGQVEQVGRRDDQEDQLPVEHRRWSYPFGRRDVEHHAADLVHAEAEQRPWQQGGAAPDTGCA